MRRFSSRLPVAPARETQPDLGLWVWAEGESGQAASGTVAQECRECSQRRLLPARHAEPCSLRWAERVAGSQGSDGENRPSRAAAGGDPGGEESSSFFLLGSGDAIYLRVSFPS